MVLQGVINMIALKTFLIVILILIWYWVNHKFYKFVDDNTEEIGWRWFFILNVWLYSSTVFSILGYL